MKKISSIILIAVLLLATITSSNAAGNISAKMFSDDGTVCYQYITNLSTSEVTSLMSSGGALYSNNCKSVALVSAAPNCTVDRVRVRPYDTPTYGGGDLRIDPNYSSNHVGDGERNQSKQVHAVQTLLYILDYPLSASGSMEDCIDGVFGSYTENAIRAFQRQHGLPVDGIVGANTWRGLCSSSTFRYGSTTW